MKLNQTTSLALLIVLISSYLCLVNLGNAALWHDEGNVAITAHNIYKTGGYNGWDGRNLFTGRDGKALDPDLNIITYPPWRALPSVLGIHIFGFNEYGVRFFHTILGLLSVVVFWFIVKQEYPNNRRLCLLALACYALSTQAILFFRYGRYTADALFFTLLVFYCYRKYLSTSKLEYLIVLTIAVVLNILNHYFIGAISGIAFAAHHCVYHWRHTTRKQWLYFMDAGFVAAIVCIVVLALMGVFTYVGQLEFSGLNTVTPYPKLVVLRQYYALRDIIMQGVIPFWFIVLLLLLALNRCVLLFQSTKFAIPPTTTVVQKLNDYTKKIDDGLPRINHFCFIILVYVLVYPFTQNAEVRGFPFMDLRYYVPILPFASIVVAALIEWVYRTTHKFFGILVLLIFLNSNLLAQPVIHPNLLSHEKLQWLLPSLVEEVHQDYDGVVDEVVRFIGKRASQDELINVPSWPDVPTYRFYLGDKLIFCCTLPDDHDLSEERIQEIGDHLLRSKGKPNWVLLQTSNITKAQELLDDNYKLVFTSESFGYPSQRPELLLHLFKPIRHQSAPKTVLFYKPDYLMPK